QGQYQPMPFERQVLIIFAAIPPKPYDGSDSKRPELLREYLLEYPVGVLARYEKELNEFVDSKFPELMPRLREKKALDEALMADIVKALDAFQKAFDPNLKAARG